MKTWTCDREAYKLFHEAMKALSQVEANGIRVDEEFLGRALRFTARKMKELEAELRQDPVWKVWRRRWGNKTKIGANDQLRAVIFEELGYKPSNRKTASGNAAADEAAFAHVDLPFVKTFFDIAKLEKCHSTYLMGIQRETVNGYLHPNFNLHSTITYRSSSDNPNFQNMPIRNPRMARLIRPCLLPRWGHQLIEIDFSGAEVRVSACYNKDPNLIKYITDPTTDMHRDTAADIFLLKKEEVDKKGPRDCAKNMFVFPQFYGSVWFQCAPAMWDAMIQRKFKIAGTENLVVDHLKKKGITKLGKCIAGEDPEPGTFGDLVRKAEKGFWEERFKVYAQWKRDYFSKYQRTGGFKMHSGFACHGVFKRNDVLNYAVQGASFHCLLWSLVQLNTWLMKNKMRTKIVGQIHDSILADVHPEERDEFLAKCKQVMTKDLLVHFPWLIVPMDIEAEATEVDQSWHEKKPCPLP